MRGKIVSSINDDTYLFVIIDNDMRGSLVRIKDVSAD